MAEIRKTIPNNIIGISKESFFVLISFLINKNEMYPDNKPAIINPASI